ncbi:MAG: GC-type dockerin domain-anchored protein [Phycisphaerales bacterium]
MRQYFGIAALVAAAGLSSTALGQDSVSNSSGNLPGDALSPWTQGCAAYVIDLAPVTTSQGNVFGIAPVLKTSKSASANFNSLGSSVSISPDLAEGVAYSRAAYSFWDMPGMGVNNEQNDAGTTVNTTGTANRFALAMSEFSTTDSGANFNGIIGALVNYDPASPNRLFVDRRMGAVNTPDGFTGDSSQLGGSSIDANGNLYYRADNFGSSGPNQVSGQNIFRTRLADRDCGVLNLISSISTQSDATNGMLIGSATTHSVPSNVPASAAGGNGLYAGPNFNGEYVYGATAGASTATTGHLDNSVTVDQRGTFGQTGATPFGGVYTLANASNDLIFDNTTVVNVFGVDATGAVTGNAGFEVPLVVMDNADGFTTTYIDGVYQNRHVTGSTAFRGGVGSVAVGADGAGNNLIATTMSENGFTGDFANQIIVGRYTTPGTIEWTMAAYVDQLNSGTMDAGKPIVDDMGVEIGQLVDLLSVTGGSPFGPSLSAPAFDSAGNVWFMASVELYDRLPDGGSDFDGALIRAIYDEATFSYSLELVLEVGTVVTGPNSNRDYRIDFLGTATGSSNPTPSSVWSSAVSDVAWNGVDPSTLDAADPMTNGGAVIQTGITYDINGDGAFNNPTSINFDPALPADETYQVALYVGYFQDGPPPCPADLAAPFGVLNFFDIAAYINLYNANDPAADLAAPFGALNFFDISTFIGFYNAGCP